MSSQPLAIGVFSAYLGGYYEGGMLSGIHQVTRKAGVPLIVIQQGLGDHPIPALSSDAVAGWIVIHPHERDRAHLAALCAGKAPVVSVPVPLDGPACTLVQVDNYGGMRNAVLHLIDHGHRRIAYIDHGPEAWSQARYQGYCDALAERGVPFDSELVLRMESSSLPGYLDHKQRGEQALQELWERGMPCTALVAATDNSAISAMQTFQALGGRIPKDLAVVGFDDIVEAQYASPPLTTVRSQFDALGRAAAEHLLAEIRNGRSSEPQIISVPTTLLHRRSCGCTTFEEILAGAAEDRQHDSSTWQMTLLQRLVQVVRYPLPLDPAVPPEHYWPGAKDLIAALETTLRGEQATHASIQPAWQQAVAQTENLELLHSAFTLLEEAAEKALAATSEASRRLLVAALLREMRLELMRVRLGHENGLKQQLAEYLSANNEVGMALLNSTLDDVRSLRWLDHTLAVWGCLGLWEERPANDAARLKIAGTYQRGSAPADDGGQMVSIGAFPLIESLPLSARSGQDLTILCPIRSQTRAWGVLALCGWADVPLATSTENLAIQVALLGAALERNTALVALTEQQATLQASFYREQVLSRTIRELGCPIIPLLQKVLLVPLIGAIDSQRTEQIMSTVLNAISEHQAETILFDITGVPIVDTQVASSLIQTTQAAGLLGARVVMVGIRPEIAQSIVGLGVDLQQLTIYATLASALSMLRLQQSGQHR